MSALTKSVFCLALNFSAIVILGYLRYLLSLDRGYSMGAGIWVALALLLLLISTLVFYITEQSYVVKIVWFLSAICVLILLFYG
jgi:hypothetical protein